MVFEKKKVNGIGELNEALKTLKGRTIVLFTGSKDGEKSWCPDCVRVEPVIEKVVGEIASSGDAQELTFVECDVGLRAYWKNQSNPFRTDERFKLTEIPTLMEYGIKGKRLSGEQCAKEALVKELFSED